MATPTLLTAEGSEGTQPGRSAAPRRKQPGYERVSRAGPLPGGGSVLRARPAPGSLSERRQGLLPTPARVCQLYAFYTRGRANTARRALACVLLGPVFTLLVHEPVASRG